MNSVTLAAAMSATTYPGRGIVIGKNDMGKLVVAYFIMGRSENSRNRVFVQDCEGLRTQAHDASKLSDPSLVIYSPVRMTKDTLIVTNGDQTDTVYDYLMDGKTFEDALRTRTFEPDPPILTPRISGLLPLTGDSYTLSILKSANGDASSARRYFYEYENPLNGQGHFIHTYAGDGSPVPSFEGEPEQVEIRGGIDAIAKEIWENLDVNNKVSLFVRVIDPATGESDTRILNKLS